MARKAAVRKAVARKKMKRSMKDTSPRIVAATGVAASVGGSGYSPAAKELEEVMAGAVKECYAQGITEPEKIRARMLAAREKYRAGK